MPSVVLVTGLSRSLGCRLAAQLAGDPSIERVIGIDTVPPRTADLRLLGRTEFVRADIRNPLVAKVIDQARVTVVVHAALMGSPHAVGGNVAMHEMNVIGTMQLLAACQKSETVGRVVLKSTTAVYGASARDPAVFSEDMHPSDGREIGYAKDAVEVEGYLRGFARRRPDIETTVLRFANLIGPGSDSALSRYLAMPVVPTVLGFDPRIQLLHEIDAVETLRLATVTTRPGVFNVAGAGPMPLSQMLRRAARVRLPVPRPVIGVAGALVRNSGVAEFTADEADYLAFGRAVDTTRLRTTFGYTPRFTTAAALESYLERQRRLPQLGALALGVGSHMLAARRERRPALISS